MNTKEAALAKAKALREAKKSNNKPAVKQAAKPVKKSNGKEKKSTPRANSKTAQILEMLKNGSTREQIRKKYGMEKVSDVSWYVSKLKRVGRLPQSFEAKD